MTLDERVKDVQKRLDFATGINLRPEEWHVLLVSIVKDARQDGAEEERETCAKIAEDGKEFKPRDHRYEAELIASQIRARSS